MHRDRLRRAARVPVTLVLGGLLAGSLAAALHPVGYSATARVYVDLAGRAAPMGIDLTEQMVDSWRQVATTPLVLDRVIRDLRLRESTAHLASRVAVQRPADTVLLEIRATDASAAGAARLADRVADVLQQESDELQPEGSARTHLTVLGRARVPVAPTLLLGPDLLLGGAGGMLAALVALAVRHRPRRPPTFPTPAMPLG